MNEVHASSARRGATRDARPRRPHRLLAGGLALLAAGMSAFAFACVPAASVAEAETGDGSAALLRALVDGVDPNLPPVPGAPEPEASLGDDVTWLLQRDLVAADLPPATPASLWSGASRRLVEHYGAALPPSPPPDDASLRSALAHWLLDAADGIEPAALVATGDDDPERVAFVAVLWPSPIYPRLIVRRPPEGPVLADGMESFLATLGTCAVPVEEYIRAPASVALDLFIAENETRMAVVATEPEGDGGVRWIPSGEEVSAFLFDAPGFAEVERYAAVFAGPSPGPFALARVLPRVRTSLGPREIQQLISNTR